MRTEEEITADARPGAAFSNRSEYDIWAARYCYRCVHDDAETEAWCPILSVAMISDSTPREWTSGAVTTQYGSYEAIESCTEFEERRDHGGDDDQSAPTPQPEVDGQLDIVDAYLDTAIGELSRAPAQVQA